MMNQEPPTKTAEKIRQTANIPPAQSPLFDEPKWLMPALDMSLAVIAFVLAYIVRYNLQLIRPVTEVNQAPFEPYLPYVLIYAGLLFLGYHSSGLYRTVRGRSWLEEVYFILNGVTSTTVILMAISFVAQPLVFSRLMMIYVAAITIVLLASLRAFRRYIQANLRARGIGVERVLVVGANEVGMAVMRILIARKELGYRPVGYIDSQPDRAQVDLGRVHGLGGLADLEHAIADYAVDTVMITLPWSDHDGILHVVETCKRYDVSVQMVPDFFQLNLRQVQVETLDGIPLMRVNHYAEFPVIDRLLKRTVDVTLVILSMPIWLPIFGLVALAIKLEDGGDIFYRQKRVGENGNEFNIIKFRSMVPNAHKLHAKMVAASGDDPRHAKFKDDPRVTGVGRFIRKWSIDELPNLINVLTGEMSLVGPRPALPEEVKQYEPWHAQRLQVMPGVTGLWQVSGRSDVPFDEMCLLDIYYIENWSLKLDMQILMMTIPLVLFRHGAY